MSARPRRLCLNPDKEINKGVSYAVYMLSIYNAVYTNESQKSHLLRT